jgi:DNA-binding XRE family transcriptional regulator
MIRYSIEQKVALIKKMELYRLDHNLSYNKFGELINMDPIAIQNWEKGKTLPKIQACFQIEKLLINYTPTIHLENLDADYINKCVDESKKRLYKSVNKQLSKSI